MCVRVLINDNTLKPKMVKMTDFGIFFAVKKGMGDFQNNSPSIKINTRVTNISTFFLSPRCTVFVVVIFVVLIR